MTETETVVHTNLAEELAISLYLTNWPERSHVDWGRAHPSLRTTHRVQAARLLEEGHLNKILLEHEQQCRGRWVDVIRRTIPAEPANPSTLERAVHQATRGALESAATIVRGRPA